MLELNSKPKKLVIQRHTKSNNWLTEAVMTKDEVLSVLSVGDGETEVETVLPSRTWTEEEVYYLLETFEIPTCEGYGDLETCPVRILNEHNKVILSTASHDFLIAAGRSGHITVRENIKNDDGEDYFIMNCYSAKNAAYPHIREFQKFIGRHGGISHTSKYPRDEKDGWEQVWKVYFKDGSTVTVGTHQLYMCNGTLVSHFAGDNIIVD
jgi:hypothetical protein